MLDRAAHDRADHFVAHGESSTPFHCTRSARERGNQATEPPARAGRISIMRTRTVAASALALAATIACAQDAQWLRDYQRAQSTRPEQIRPVARIAPASEPGTPLVIHGRVLGADGKTPLPGVVVFAYQTDRGGVYNARGESGWRLRGWARSDAQGRFEFRTIRPGSYPGTRNPAHVHLTIEGPGPPAPVGARGAVRGRPSHRSGAEETVGRRGTVRPGPRRDAARRRAARRRFDPRRRREPVLSEPVVC
jgi:hypothetical protein